MPAASVPRWSKLPEATTPLPSAFVASVTRSDQVLRSVRPMPRFSTRQVTVTVPPDCALAAVPADITCRSAYGIGMMSTGAVLAALFDSRPFSNTWPAPSACTNSV